MFEDLNEAQRRAVEYGDGPLLILAGAGTGKTRTITFRIAHLIEKGVVEAKQVMAVTFTRKAAQEMTSRLQGLLSHPAKVQDLNLGTFHALSGSLLRESMEPTVKPELLPEKKQIELIKKILQRQTITGPGWQPLEVLRLISLAKGQLHSPDDLAARADIQLATVYRLYQRTLTENRLLDFDDLVGGLLQQWEMTPEVLSRHQRLFRFIFVDEFQDVNKAQYRWLKLLAAPHRNLCVVGDTDQSIYSFRGSNVDIFNRFQQDFPEVQMIKLEQNYRSSQLTLEAAAGVIAHNHNPLTCRLWSESDSGPLLRCGRLADEVHEARFVVKEIERLLGGSSHYQIYQGSDVDTPADTRYGFADIAVLFRTHAQSRPLAEALSRSGVPYQLVGEKAPFDTLATNALLSYLRFALEPSSPDDLKTIFNLPPRGLGEKAQQWLDREMDKGIKPWEILRLASRNMDLPVRYQAALDRLRRTIVSLQSLISTLPLPQLLERGWEETGLLQHFQESGTPPAESFRWLLLLAGLHGEKPAVEVLPAFLNDLAQWRVGDFYDPRAHAVTLMTLHAAKGLEFPVVFICGLDQGLLPLIRTNQEEDALEEERRLFYVAMTRSRHLLVLSTVRRRFLYGEYRDCQPSQFIKEIPPHCLEEVSVPPSKKKKPQKKNQLSLF
jgi:DNA helicase-2/ATP-dependent DNA helicase PcrA